MSWTAARKIYSLPKQVSHQLLAEVYLLAQIVSISKLA